MNYSAEQRLLDNPIELVCIFETLKFSKAQFDLGVNILGLGTFFEHKSRIARSRKNFT